MDINMAKEFIFPCVVGNMMALGLMIANMGSVHRVMYDPVGLFLKGDGIMGSRYELLVNSIDSWCTSGQQRR
jgi:hypothetical protein